MTEIKYERIRLCWIEGSFGGPQIIVSKIFWPPPQAPSPNFYPIGGDIIPKEKAYSFEHMCVYK